MENEIPASIIPGFKKKYAHLLKELYQHPLNLDTNWYLATGAPSSGKSTSLRKLQREGYRINPDISREYIVELKKRGVPFTKEVLYSMETQKILFMLMTADALELDPDDFIIHDYSLPDNLAFLRLGGLDIPDEIQQSTEIFRYRKVFLFEPLEMVQDGIRTEDREDQEKLFYLLQNTYESIGYDPILVKSDTVENRHKFLLSNLPKL